MIAMFYLPYKYMIQEGSIDDKIIKNKQHMPIVQPMITEHQTPPKLNNNDEKPTSTPNYHTVFSTDCSGYQHWQSYLLFYSAYKVKQPGTVTRIASGCTKEEQEAERAFQSQISDQMSSNFKVHFTPQFSKVKGEGEEGDGETYKFFNKPFGLLHWIEHAEVKIKDDDIVILLDPDQVLTRPITNDFSNQSENTLVGQNPKTIVTHGSPFAQEFGFGASWRNLDIDAVTGTNDSPAKSVTEQDAIDHYPAGPPYLATTKDMHAIARTWSDFVPRSYKIFPELMAEMYAFCIAVAHLKMPHQIVKSLMVSDVDVEDGEGWNFVEAIEDEKICSPAAMGYSTLPSVLHYCQRYVLGKHIFGKHKMPLDTFSCDAPLLAIPPEDIAERYDYWIDPNLVDGKREYLTKIEVKKTAFMICFLTHHANEASKFYKSRNCKSSEVSAAPLKIIDLWSGKTSTSSTKKE